MWLSGVKRVVLLLFNNIDGHSKIFRTEFSLSNERCLLLFFLKVMLVYDELG